MEKLFVYGTLLDFVVQISVVGRALDASPDRLSGYRKGTVRIEENTYPIAVRDQNGEIDGSVLNIETADLPSLDAYETKAFARVRVRLQSGDDAWVYCEPD